jgi:mercuric ion transport protein
MATSRQSEWILSPVYGLSEKTTETRWNMKISGMLKTGLIGTVVTGLCCFTPVLVILFGALGIGALVSYLDLILLPALAVFLGITFYAWKRRTSNSENTAP